MLNFLLDVGEVLVEGGLDGLHGVQHLLLDIVDVLVDRVDHLDAHLLHFLREEVLPLPFPLEGLLQVVFAAVQGFEHVGEVLLGLVVDVDDVFVVSMSIFGHVLVGVNLHAGWTHWQQALLVATKVDYVLSGVKGALHVLDFHRNL